MSRVMRARAHQSLHRRYATANRSPILSSRYDARASCNLAPVGYFAPHRFHTPDFLYPACKTFLITVIMLVTLVYR